MEQLFVDDCEDEVRVASVVQVNIDIVLRLGISACDPEGMAPKGRSSDQPKEPIAGAMRL